VHECSNIAVSLCFDGMSCHNAFAFYLDSTSLGIGTLLCSGAVTSVKTFASGLIQAVCAKTAESHVALPRNFSSPVSATDPVKSSKTLQVLQFALKNIFWLRVADFLSDIISGGLLGHLGPLHLALGPNR